MEQDDDPSQDNPSGFDPELMEQLRGMSFPQMMEAMNPEIMESMAQRMFDPSSMDVNETRRLAREAQERARASLNFNNVHIFYLKILYDHSCGPPSYLLRLFCKPGRSFVPYYIGGEELLPQNIFGGNIHNKICQGMQNLLDCAEQGTVHVLEDLFVPSSFVANVAETLEASMPHLSFRRSRKKYNFNPFNANQGNRQFLADVFSDPSILEDEELLDVESCHISDMFGDNEDDYEEFQHIHEVGVLVKLQGLQSKPELNDTFGVIVKEQLSSGRWPVELLDEARTVSIKAVNLEIVITPD